MRRAPPADLLREAEVEHFDLTALIDDDVRRLDIAVNDPVPMRFAQGLRHVSDNAQTLRDRQFASPQKMRQVLSANQLHDDNGCPSCVSP